MLYECCFFYGQFFVLKEFIADFDYLHANAMYVKWIYVKYMSNEFLVITVWPWKFSFEYSGHEDFQCFISDFEIPDDDGERLMTPALIIEYICDKEDTYEWKSIYRYITRKLTTKQNPW